MEHEIVKQAIREVAQGQPCYIEILGNTMPSKWHISRGGIPIARGESADPDDAWDDAMVWIEKAKEMNRG